MIKPGRFRILALDVDGTLLDRDGILRPRTAAAVSRAANAGIQPILCTGRRYRRARPIAELLRLTTPIVCNSGAIVKDPCNHGTVWRADLDTGLVAEILAVFDEHGQHCVAFTDVATDQPDFIATGFPTGRPEFDDYIRQNHQFALIDPDRLRNQPIPAFHLFAVGTLAEMLAFERIVLATLAPRVQTFVQRSSRYLGTMCEVLRPDAGKWSALRQIAEMWGVSPGEVCAVGDDFNDMAMLRHAGLGVAMGHAPSEVLEVADHVTGDHESEGVATFIDDFLLT